MRKAGANIATAASFADARLKTLLSYPPTSMAIKTVNGEMNLSLALTPWMFTGLLFIVGTAMAIGKASVFKFIGDEYSDNIGAVSGVVGLAGGLGGLGLPGM